MDTLQKWQTPVSQRCSTMALRHPAANLSWVYSMLPCWLALSFTDNDKHLHRIIAAFSQTLSLHQQMQPPQRGGLHSIKKKHWVVANVEPRSMWHNLATHCVSQSYNSTFYLDTTVGTEDKNGCCCDNIDELLCSTFANSQMFYSNRTSLNLFHLLAHAWSNTQSTLLSFSFQSARSPRT